MVFFDRQVGDTILKLSCSLSFELGWGLRKGLTIIIPSPYGPRGSGGRSKVSDEESEELSNNFSSDSIAECIRIKYRAREEGIEVMNQKSGDFVCRDCQCRDLIRSRGIRLQLIEMCKQVMIEEILKW